MDFVCNSWLMNINTHKNMMWHFLALRPPNYFQLNWKEHEDVVLYAETLFQEKKEEFVKWMKFALLPPFTSCALFWNDLSQIESLRVAESITWTYFWRIWPMLVDNLWWGEMEVMILWLMCPNLCYPLEEGQNKGKSSFQLQSTQRQDQFTNRITAKITSKHANVNIASKRNKEKENTLSSAFIINIYI